MNKPQYIWMRDTQYSHVRSTTYAALLYDFSRLIDDVHEANGARRDPPGRIHHRTGRAHEFIRHPGAAARLMNDRNVLRVFHYSFDRVRYVQYETRSQLPFRFSCVYQAWCIRNKLACEYDRCHVIVESGTSLRVTLRLRNVPHHATYNVAPG